MRETFAVIFRKCDPACEWPAWKCWWDDSWVHTHLCLYGWGPLRRDGSRDGIYGVLWFLCKDCRDVRRT